MHKPISRCSQPIEIARLVLTGGQDRVPIRRGLDAVRDCKSGLVVAVDEVPDERQDDDRYISASHGSFPPSES